MSSEKRILIVDDEPEHRDIWEMVLRKRGYAVRSLPDCSRLFAMIGQYNPALIIMDHYMPGMNGAEAIRLLKAHPVYKDIPVIYFSADEDLPLLASDAGADEYVRKPCSLKELSAAVQRYFL